MNLFKTILVLIPTLLLLGLVSCTKQATSDKAKDSSVHEDPNGYWTCPMHPQIHQHEAGKCPICGMPLVLVKADANKPAPKIETSAPIDVSPAPLKNSHISKFKIEKKDLLVELFLSGRMITTKEISFQIYESDLPAVKVGMEFTGSLASHPQEVLKGKIQSIDKLVDPSSRTLRVTGILSSSTSNYFAEASFHGQIKNLLKNQLLIPEESILHTGTRDLVYVFTQDNQLEARKVTLGQKSQGLVQVLSGLNEGEEISTGANFLIDSEAKIRGH